MVKLKRKINLEKRNKKNQSKEWRSKLTYKIKINFWLKGEIEKKNNFNKRKKIKRMKIKLVKIIYHNFGLKDGIKNI